MQHQGRSLLTSSGTVVLSELVPATAVRQEGGAAIIGLQSPGGEAVAGADFAVGQVWGLSGWVGALPGRRPARNHAPRCIICLRTTILLTCLLTSRCCLPAPTRPAPPACPPNPRAPPLPPCLPARLPACLPSCQTPRAAQLHAIPGTGAHLPLVDGTRLGHQHPAGGGGHAPAAAALLLLCLLLAAPTDSTHPPAPTCLHPLRICTHLPAPTCLPALRSQRKHSSCCWSWSRARVAAAAAAGLTTASSCR